MSDDEVRNEIIRICRGIIADCVAGNASAATIIERMRLAMEELKRIWSWRK